MGVFNTLSLPKSEFLQPPGPIPPLDERHVTMTLLRISSAALLLPLAALSHSALAQSVPPGYITGVTATATSSQGPTPVANLVGDDGLTETAPGSGIYTLTTDDYSFNSNTGAYRGFQWISGGVAYGQDENATADFDLGATYTVDRIHVWNGNSPGYTFRDLRDVTVSYSLDGKFWTTAARLTLAQAPGAATYAGEDYTLPFQVSGRYLRFHANSTYRVGGGFPDLASLGKVRFHGTPGGAAAVPASLPPLPSDAGQINVKLAPYSAKGDGKTDDTAALQQAITDYQGTRRTIYLPAGTYRVSKTLALRVSSDLFGNTNIRGRSRGTTILKLADATFTDPANPQAVLFMGYHPTGSSGVSADWFSNHVSDLTIDTGKGNPGADGIQFYSNNEGALRNVTVRSGDGQGVNGVNLAYADQNGPLLVKNVAVYGFQYGIHAAGGINSQTLEYIVLSGQTTAGVYDEGQNLSMRGIYSANKVPAFRGYGVVTLLDSLLFGGAPGNAAIVSGEQIFVRNVTTRGYGTALQDNNGTAGAPVSVACGRVAEYVSSPVLSLFPSPARSLRLPVRDTPAVPQDDPNLWANVRSYRLLSDPDDTLSIQRAIDSGATTVYLPTSTYFVSGPIFLRGAACRLVGGYSILSVYGSGSTSFQLTDSVEAPSVVSIEGLNTVPVSGSLSRTLVLKDDTAASGTLSGTGQVFLEDSVGGPFSFTGLSVWARQLNTENSATNILNSGGDLWILGLKTEKNATLIDTEAGGQTELLGGLSYTQDNGGVNPMFVNNESSVSLTIGEVAFNGQPFTTLLTETRDGVTRTLKRQGQPGGDLFAPLRPAYLGGSVLPLYTGYR